MPADSPVNILLVDDRPESLLTLEAVLKQPGWRLVTAASGAEALERLARDEFAVILLDVQMPEMDGFETARRIKLQPHLRSVPIIFVTAINKDPTHIFRGYDSGAIDYLTKPFDDFVLRSKVGVIVELYEKSRRIQEQDQALRTAHDQLEQRVQERTAELVAANRALHLEIVARRRTQGELESSLREKEVLLKEIHHRVKNNLQVIASLLSLQSNYIREPRLLELFQESRNRIYSMALVHETLYSSTNLSSIDMSGYVRELIGQLTRAYAAERVRMRVRVEPIRLGVDTAVPCGLLLNELISNAFKHAFPDGRAGEVTVELGSITDDRFMLTVQDNGVGVPPDVDLLNTGTLGLRLVDALVGQLQGRIQMDRNGGTTFTVHFSPVQQAIRSGAAVAA